MTTQHTIVKQSSLKLIRNVSKSVVLLLVQAWFIACEKPSNQDEQSFQELSLDTELASISVIDDSLCIVGGENGDIYVLKDGKVCNHIHSDESRIYSVFYDDADTCFLGIKNTGVVRCRKPNLSKKGKLEYVDIEKSNPQYKCIPNNNEHNKKNNYSPYGFIKYSDDKILTTTSNGLYYFSSSQRQDTLDFIPGLNHEAGKSFAYCSPVSIDRRIFIASDNGIIMIDKKNADIKKGKHLLGGKRIVKLEVDKAKEKLYALAQYSDNMVSKDKLYVLGLDSDTYEVDDSCQLPSTAFSMVYVKDKLYFINSHFLFVLPSKEKKLAELKEEDFKIIKLPHIVASDTRNTMAYDSAYQKIRIVTKRSVLSFPAVNGIGASDVVLQSCYDKATEKLYFLNTKNELFEYGENKVSRKVLQLSRDEEILNLHAYDDAFFYISNHRELKKVVNKGVFGFINKKLNYINQSICTRISDLAHPSTAMFVDGDTAFVGIKDSLLRINLNTGKSLNSNDRPVNSYITRFRKTGNDIYATTLNDGLINLTKNNITNQEKQFLNDYVIINDSSSLLLDNHYVLYQKDDSVKDSLRIEGCRLLVYRNKGVVISSRKVQFFSINFNLDRLEKGSFYDWHINPEACSIIEDTLFLATDWGLMRMNVRDEEYQSQKTAPIIFENKQINWIKTTLLLISIILLLLVGLFVSRIYKKDIESLGEKEKIITDALQKGTKATKDFTLYVVKPECAEVVIKRLHERIDGLKKPKDIMRCIRAAEDAKAISKPEWKSFCMEFGIDKISKTSFNNYLNKNYDYYSYISEDKEAYKSMIEEFKKLIT